MNIYSIVCILHYTKNILKEKSAFVTVYEAVGELIFIEVLVISISYSWIEYLHGNVRVYYYITLTYEWFKKLFSLHVHVYQWVTWHARIKREGSGGSNPPPPPKKKPRTPLENSNNRRTPPGKIFLICACMIWLMISRVVQEEERSVNHISWIYM